MGFSYPGVGCGIVLVCACWMWWGSPVPLLWAGCVGVVFLVLVFGLVWGFVLLPVLLVGSGIGLRFGVVAAVCFLWVDIHIVSCECVYLSLDWWLGIVFGFGLVGCMVSVALFLLV